jgi:hypothetical protein
MDKRQDYDDGSTEQLGVVVGLEARTSTKGHQ